MTREQLKDAVVAAAQTWARVPKNDQEELDRAIALRQAVRAFDAHTDAQEVVTLAVWGLGTSRDFSDPSQRRSGQWERLGTVTLPLTPERGR